MDKDFEFHDLNLIECTRICLMLTFNDKGPTAFRSAQFATTHYRSRETF